MTDHQHAAQLAVALRKVIESQDPETTTLGLGIYIYCTDVLAAWDRHVAERTEQQLPLDNL